MTGWDTPSRPTWDPQDGPEDGTQAFSGPDTAAGDNDPWAAPAGSGWGTSAQTGSTEYGGSGPGGTGPNGVSPGPPPEFFTQEFEQRTPGASLRRDADAPSWDLPVRGGDGRGSTGRGGNGAGAQAPAWEQAPAWDEPQWPDAQRQEYPRQDEYGRQDPARQDPARQDFGGPDFDRPEFGSADEYGRQDLPRRGQTRQDLDRPEFGSQGFGPQDFGSQDFGSQDPGREEFPRRQPGSAYPANQQDYATQQDHAAQQDYTAQQGYPARPDSRAQQAQGDQAPAEPASPDWVMAARMDPALQDFFAPAPAGRGPGYAPRPGQGPQGPQGRQGPPARRELEAPARPVDPWDDAPGFQPSGPQGGGSGGTGSYDRPGRRTPPGGRKPSGGRTGRIVAVGGVVVVVVAAGAYLLIHKSGNSNAAGNVTPTVGASTQAAAPTATAKAKAKANAKAAAKTPRVSGTGSADAWVLSTPSVAGSYPLGTDPHFLATTTATASTIEKSAVAGGGGTVTGNPVSASYTLPAAQTIEFVGYQGTFNPKKVMTNLGSFGSTEATYSAGPHGGEMACANVPATASAASGGVCVWVTTTTLGVTEFFTQSNGPEVLTVAQSKGADDTVALRASVETRKS